MPQNEAMGWVSSHPQDTNCDTNPFPSVLSWANFCSLYWNYPFQNQRWPPTLSKPMVDSQFSFNMTYPQQATQLSSCLHLKCFLYLVPRTPYTLSTVRLPSFHQFPLTLLCALVLISVSSAQKFLQFSDLFLIIISSLGQQFSSMLVSGLLYTLKINKKLKKIFVYEHDTYR